jgi:hypothetical protein
MMQTMPEETSMCVACRGTVVKNTTMEYLGDYRNLIIGPGSRSQMTPVTNIHCTKCGLKYEFLPPDNISRPVHFSSPSGSFNVSSEHFTSQLSPSTQQAINEEQTKNMFNHEMYVTGGYEEIKASPCPTCGTCPRRASCPTKCDEV